MAGRVKPNSAPSVARALQAAMAHNVPASVPGACGAALADSQVRTPRAGQ